MIQVKQANNSQYNTSNSSLELKSYMDQIASTQNLREQLVNQIYLITAIQKSINDNSIEYNLDTYLAKYNDSIATINGAIISNKDKVSYFDINKEKSTFEKQQFTTKLAYKCEEVEKVFNDVATLNAQAINNAKLYISSHKNDFIDYSSNININNSLLTNKQ